MSRRYTSYLLRLWERDDGIRRIEIEHIQDGAHVVIDTLLGALNWIDGRAIARASDTPASEAGPLGHGPPAGDERPP
jgi:hypothetical protein